MVTVTTPRPARAPHARFAPLAPVALALLVAACGGGGGDDEAVVPGSIDVTALQADGADPREPVVSAPREPAPADPVPTVPAGPDPMSATARYRVTLENLWGAEDFPQDFPEDAHLSLVGGALHDDTISFWSPGTVVSAAMEDLAETGRIDLLLEEEVAPAIVSGAAGSRVEVREYVGPQVNGVPGRLSFEIEVDERWPLLTLATMLGPSPDWFVGTDGLALRDESGWTAGTSVDLPLYDGGSKSDIVPVMGGADIIPPEPVGFVAYDPATGTYLGSDVPQVVARVVLERLR